MRHPKHLTTGQIKKYFTKFGLKSIVNEFERSINNNHNSAYPPDLMDLYRLHRFIIINKRICTLEFGSGWSSIVINHALKINKKKFFNLIKNKNLRFPNAFEHFALENEKKYLNISRNRVKKYFKKNNQVNFSYSKNIMSTFNGIICNEYINLPAVNPDFIYLDGPDQFNILKKKNNISIAREDMMPMNCDLLKIEFFLTPGTIIVVDGRGANAQFLKYNFKRKWKYEFKKKYDQHVFELQEETLGKINSQQLDFYKQNF